MPRTATSTGTSEDLIKAALAKFLADPNAELPLRAARGGSGLFAGATAPVRHAVEQSTGPDGVFAESRAEGATKYVRLTVSGFKRVLAELPEPKKIDALVSRLGMMTQQDAKELAVAGYNDVAEDSRDLYLSKVKGLPDGGTLVAEIARRAVQETKPRLDRLQKEYRALHRSVKMAVDALEAVETDMRAVAETQKGLVARFGQLTEPAGDVRTERVPRTLPDPRTADEKDFRKAAFFEMVETWFALTEAKQEEAAYMVEGLLQNLPDTQRIGEVGEIVAFDPAIHESHRMIETGDPARVEHVGWELVLGEGTVIPRKAVVVAA